jgi:N-acetylmuramic acid 6-phosphate etherase
MESNPGPGTQAGAGGRTGADRLDNLVTESRAADPAGYDRLSTRELVESMNRLDAEVPAAVSAAAEQTAAAIDVVVERLKRGGRLVYVGAGSSGQIAALDAAECESTFSVEPGRVLALVAGAGAATAGERDAAEDDAGAGVQAVEDVEVSEADAVIGVSASGRTPYVLGALEAAKAAGAATVCIVSVPSSELARLAEKEISVIVGPEFIAGSTRLKAGTAQKLVLNTISTVAMVRLGKTYGDLMVDVSATNEKLRARARRTVRLATEASDEEVDRALEAAGGSAKVAIVSLLTGVDADTAREKLRSADDNIGRALA